MGRNTYIITESQEKKLIRMLSKKLFREGVESLKGECSDQKEFIGQLEDGQAGKVGDNVRNIGSTNKIAKELSAPDWTRFGKYLTGY